MILFDSCKSNEDNSIWLVDFRELSRGLSEVIVEKGFEYCYINCKYKECFDFFLIGVL